MDSIKAEAEPIKEISHIQKIAPGPPIAIAVATPAKLPVPTLEAVPIQKAWNEEIDPFSDEEEPSLKSLNISFIFLNWTKLVFTVKYIPSAIKTAINIYVHKKSLNIKIYSFNEMNKILQKFI